MKFKSFYMGSAISIVAILGPAESVLYRMAGIFSAVDILWQSLIRTETEPQQKLFHAQVVVPL
ncbi:MULTISPECIES: hypothetical protein [Nitrosomonas]|uniref:Uncharacterized protein n=2 Tax=Nitrosomonas TaxID=914 RepID=A0A0F7KIR4_9PROT|nr:MULTISPECIES: hypothetical protein [Nitrosomonas]AKH38834.1 hypothetical protein AAW31_15135 [Nitrosomonas communis]TYP79882.1 hypothetical protein BCL69_10662 [Nitrosomonas communis]UVS60951.1 hypothetical protein NX761_15875 [Nitrosomonas sp. PLL12]